MQKLLYFLFGVLILTPVSGELWRVPVGSVALLPSDLLIPLILLLWGIDKLKKDRVWRLGKITRRVLLFLGVVVLTFGLNLWRFDPQEMRAAFTGLGRLGLYTLLAPVAYDLLQRDQGHRFAKLLLTSLVGAMALIVLAGFLQLQFFPSLQDLGLHFQGWDPHVGRLLSTWLDPNFVGGYLTFMLCLTTALSLYFYHQKEKRLFCLLAGLSFFSLMALYWTFSRSSYLAMMGALVILSFFKSRRLFVAGVLVFILAFSLSPRMQQRSLDAVDSGRSILGLDSQKPLDPTARFRVESWAVAWEMIQDYPLLGVGYNRYAYELNERGEGLMSTHSSSGSDSSLLTLWATTGLLGLLAYLAMAFVAVVVALKQIWRRNDFKSYLAAGLLAGYGGLFVHSIFVNSLLFALIMIPFWLGLALLEEGV